MWFQDNVCSFDQAAVKIQHSSNPAKHGTVLTIFGSCPACLLIAKAGDFFCFESRPKPLTIHLSIFAWDMENWTAMLKQKDQIRFRK